MSPQRPSTSTFSESFVSDRPDAVS